MSRDFRGAIAAGLNESFKHRHVDGFACAICGAKNRKLALHVIKYAQAESDPLPAGVVPQSASMGTIRGGFGLCDSCAPACPKCQLPVPNKKVRAFYQATHSKLHSESSPVLWGNGTCQHMWLFGKWPL